MENDRACSIAPYFRIHPGQQAAFEALCEKFVEKTRPEEGCLFYGFSFAGDEAHCREAYRDAAALLAHLQSVDALIKEILTISDLSRVEIHGPAGEVDKLREPLAPLQPTFFVLKHGFRH